jgi:hypothetical protein
MDAGMKRKTLARWFAAPLFGLACLAAPAVRAQDPVILNQQFELRYDRWQVSGQENVTSADASYDFVVGAPVGSYRLGAMAFLGTLAYDRLTIGNRSSSSAGLNRYGFRISLFPYRRFHLTLDYAHQQSPAFFGAERTRSNTYGVDYRLRGIKGPNLRIAARYGDTDFYGDKESWTLWTVEGDQRVGRTFYSFQFFRQDMEFSAPGTHWSVNSLVAQADMRLNDVWRLSSYLTAAYFSGDTSMQVSSSLWGNIGPWTSASSASVTFEQGPNGSGYGLTLSQSLSRTYGPFTYFGSADLIGERVSYDVPGTSTPASNVGAIQGGAMWQFAQDWTLVGDVALLAGQRSQYNTGGTGLASSVHVGIARGGELPEILRHTLFFISDLTFDRAVSQEYPPGYVPQELAMQLVQRRLRQQGTLSFAADYWHSQANWDGRQDWFRVTGTMDVSARLKMLVIADWRKDNGFTFPDRYRKDEDITANASYSFGSSTVSASLGYFKSDLTGLKDAPTVLLPNRTTKFGTVGFSSIFWKIPCGFLVGRYDQGDGNPLTTYSLFGSLQYRRINLRVLYDYTQRADGWKASRISVDLLRVFDSLILWGRQRRR